MLHQITFPPNFSGWQKAARNVLTASWQPEEIIWQELASDHPLLEIASEAESVAKAPGQFKVPKTFVEMARRVSCHRDENRWALLYRLLWRITHGEHHLLEMVVDPDIQKLAAMDKAVRHDVHKMRAFVRFRAVKQDGIAWFVAWFEPQHHIVEFNAPFFVDRFANMNWSILTPDVCVHWDQKNLSFTEGARRTEAPTKDAAEALWIKYYSSIFNPSRVKVHAMQKEMPKIYWKNLPETAVIPALLNEAPKRMDDMIAKSQGRKVATEEFTPASVLPTDDLSVVRDAAMHCKACPLYKNATQTVFGEGLPNAKLILLGEQPGDKEDLAGHPFVGPAGQLLDRALAEAGIDRVQAYVTNAVKHFKFEPVGTKRIHKKPSPREAAACRPWLEAEIRLVKPKILVCLGGTAAQTVMGHEVKVLRDRGQFIKSEFSPRTFITVHPSSLLRAPDEESRRRDYQHFVEDLKLVAVKLQHQES